MRGEYGVQRTVPYGISPACAGNTTAASYRRPRGRDQPRVCGEYSSRTSVRRLAIGSAPLARGIHGSDALPRTWAGVSPACAGNTTRRPACSRAHWGQPRVCGEYYYRHSNQAGDVGSAPRVRGILCLNRRFSAVFATPNSAVSFDSLFTCHAANGCLVGSRLRHGMRHRSGGWMPAFRHASAMQRIVSVRSCEAGTLRNPWANASRTAFADQPCSTARMAIP